MPVRRRSSTSPRPSISFVVLCILLGVCWVAGGASRADALGQVIVRGTAWASLFLLILFARRPALGPLWPVMLLLMAAALVGLLQLVPLPPAIWQTLPGRGWLAEAAAASGQDQPWRPWSIVPGATVNAVSSIVVPLVALIAASGLSEAERRWMPGIVLGFVAAGMLVGLLQFSGAGFNNPFVNDTLGQVSGTFANRNHFALFLALGCLVAPVWAFTDASRLSWRGPVALGFILLFALTILASGSRTGIGLCILAISLGLALVRHRMRKALEGYPKWVLPALILGIVAVIAVFVLISVAVDRAASIDRVLAVDPGQDMRSRGLPTVLAIIAAYFPFGSGLGGFDPIFRIHEPFALLKPTYFNHAHDDFLEIAIDAGLPGILLLVAALVWWSRASIQAWSAGSGTRHLLPRLGSAILLLVLLASVLDYPMRTPMMMVVVAVAAYWLSDRQRSSSALPAFDQHL